MKSKKLLAVLSATAMVASVAPAASVFASTSGTAVALTTPIVNNTSNSTALGTVKVVIPAGSAIANQSLTLTLNNATFNTANGFGHYVTTDPSPTAANAVYVDPTNLGTVTDNTYFSSASYTNNNHSVTLQFAGNNVPLTSDLTFYIKLGAIDVTSSTAGDVNLSLDASSNTGVPTGTVKVGSVQTTGTAAVTTENTQTSNGTFLFDLKVREPYAGVVANSSTITLKLPNGYVWDDYTNPSNLNEVYGTDSFSYTATHASAANTLTITINRTGTSSDSLLDFKNLSFHLDDSSKAVPGDITAVIGSSGFSIDQSTVKVGTYGDFGVTPSVASVKSVTSGFAQQKLDTVELKESIPGSLIPNRTVTLTLPDNVEWDPSISGNIQVTDASGQSYVVTPGSVSAGQQKLTFTLNGIGPGHSATTSKAADITIKGLKVVTAPNYSGDVNVTIGGNAGLTGTLKVATAQTPVSVSVDKPSDIKLGLTNQTLGTITLKENAVGALGGGSDNVAHWVYLNLPTGVNFSTTPNVSVTDGDLTIDSNSVSVSNNQLQFKVTGSSISKASTITVENAQVTVDRTLPQEDVNLKVYGTAVQDAQAVADFGGSTASVKVGQIVTPADGTVHNVAKFVIGQSSYNVNGNDVTMDVAPYIKDSRTYLPVHFVANALGVADNNTIWDGASRTVTIFADGKVIQLKIGSKVMTVNGAPITMDVAPEIVNGRTMLPVSFVATALGYTATWDGASQTVTIQ